MEIKTGEYVALPARDYTIVRRTSYLDRMFYLYHRLGLQSNVLVAARYTSTQSSTEPVELSDEIVFAALHTIITNHPELGIIGVPEAGKDKSHLLSLASLHEIDLEKCVEFIDDNPPAVDAHLFEKLHGQWHWADGQVRKGQPWWKVIVIGRRDIIFLFHHLVCDGSFGMTFHREFLAALNDQAVLDAKLGNPRQIELDSRKVRLSDELDTAIRRKPPILGAIYNLFMFLFFHFFYSRKLFFVNFPKSRPLPKDPFAVPQACERTVTKVTSYRIPAEKTKAIIAACREHGTTFTPFLISIITGTLASDFYPEAEVGFTRYAVDMRASGGFEGLPTHGGKMINLAANMAEPEWLKKYRRAYLPLSTLGEKGQRNKAVVVPDAAWELIQNYGRRMKQIRSGGENSALHKAWLSGNALGPTLEELMEKYFPSMSLFMQNSFSVSNVGTLKPGKTPAMTIEDVQFSAGLAQGAVGYHGIVFNVAGVADGDTTINACIEDGVAPEGLPRAVLDNVMARIDALLQ